MGEVQTNQGVWLNQTQAMAATGLSFRRFAAVKVDFFQKKKSHITYYFIPVDRLQDKYYDLYRDDIIEYDQSGVAVEEILGDISKDSDYIDTDLSTELTQARLENLKAKTKYVNERLEQRKSELFREWSERFFEIFCKSFGKFKNALIDLHLDAEQTKSLEEKLDLALKAMNDGLSQINADWLNEDTETSNEETQTI